MKTQQVDIKMDQELKQRSWLMLSHRGLDLETATIPQLHEYLTELDEQIFVAIGLALNAGETEIPEAVIEEIRNCNAVVNFINRHHWAQNPNTPALFYQREWKMEYFTKPEERANGRQQGEATCN